MDKKQLKELLDLLTQWGREDFGDLRLFNDGHWSRKELDAITEDLEEKIRGLG